MRNNFNIGASIMFLFASCYCNTCYNQNSSARYLRGNKSFTVCYDPPGEGKTIMFTAYTADNAFARNDFKSHTKTVYSDLTIKHKPLFGLRAETFYKLGTFPCPLLGIGLDYSRNTFEATYLTQDLKALKNEKQNINQQRLNLSLNYVTWIRPKMMGYISMQPGFQYERNVLHTQYGSNDFTGITNHTRFNFRLGYGLQLYFLHLVAFNVEAGYGAGAYFRAGISCWLF
jgi:hypothetical protein